jgi:3-oxoacyl-[acyl-carrier protein] reductase
MLLIPGMKSDSFGRIINVVSISVKQPIPNLGVSNTIRGAVANWAKTLSYEVAPYGITVNNILPGLTNTGRLKTVIKGIAEMQNRSLNEVTNEMKNSVPSKRFAEPSETASAITFLASDQASYINGINLPVDGGRTQSL